MSEHRSLGARAARALIWQYGSTFGGRLMSLAVVAILARLLSPNDFGLVALATMFTALLDVVRDLGLGQALVIAKHEDDDAVANTVFRWGMLIGFCIWGLTIAISPLVAAFFHKPAVTPILIVLGTVFPLRALSLTHYSIAQKQLDFRSRTIAELINTGGRGVVGVALAFMGFGAWSLVLSFVAGTAMFTVALWVLVKWRPRWHAATVPVKSLLMFGGVLTMVDILAAVLYSVDVFVIGKMIGQEQLGLYSMATRLPELVVLNLSMSLGLVLFPAFAGLRVNELSGAFLKALRFTMFLSLPLAVGLVTLATPVTELLFGHKWLGSVDSMRVLVGYTFFYAIGIPAGTVYKAIGRAKLLLYLAVPQVVLVIAGSIPMARYGIVGVASVVAGVTALFFVIGLIIVPHMIPVRYADLWAACRASVTAAALTAGVLYLIARFVTVPGVAVALGIAVGAVVYLGVLWLLDADQLRYVLRKVAPGRFSGDEDEEPVPAQGAEVAAL